MVSFLLPVSDPQHRFLLQNLFSSKPYLWSLVFPILGAVVCLCPLFSYQPKESWFFSLFCFHLLSGWSGNFQAPICGTRSRKYTPPILHITSPQGRILSPSGLEGLGESSGTSERPCSPSHPEEILRAEVPLPALFLGRGRETDI